MSKDQLEVTFTCQECGGTVLNLPDDYTDDSIAECKDCGAEFGRWGDIKDKAMGLAKDRVSTMLKDTFKGLKGWKVK